MKIFLPIMVKVLFATYLTQAEVSKMNPYRFESLVVELLVKMGYGRMQYDSRVTRKATTFVEKNLNYKIVLIDSDYFSEE